VLSSTNLEFFDSSLKTLARKLCGQKQQVGILFAEVFGGKPLAKVPSVKFLRTEGTYDVWQLNRGNFISPQKLLADGLYEN
jgi:hypothetical protein